MNFIELSFWFLAYIISYNFIIFNLIYFTDYSSAVYSSNARDNYMLCPLIHVLDSKREIAVTS